VTYVHASDADVTKTRPDGDPSAMDGSPSGGDPSMADGSPSGDLTVNSSLFLYFYNNNPVADRRSKRMNKKLDNIETDKVRVDALNFEGSIKRTVSQHLRISTLCQNF
jgi:hypothetical protein